MTETACEPRAFFFDLFYTLILPVYSDHMNEYDVLHISADAWESVAEDEQLYWERATGRVCEPIDIIDAILKKGGFDATQDDMRRILEMRSERMRSALVHVDSVIIDTLRQCKANGWRLCIISNADAIDVMHWRESPLYRRMDGAVFSYEVGCVKPDPEIYRMAMARMGVAPENSVFVGDGGSDELRGAKRMGMTTVLTECFTRHDAIRPRLLQSADYHITSFSQLLRLPL